jgi:hypothetical protein
VRTGDDVNELTDGLERRISLTMYQSRSAADVLICFDRVGVVDGGVDQVKSGDE